MEEPSPATAPVETDVDEDVVLNGLALHLADLIEGARALRDSLGRDSPGRQMHVVVTNLETASLWLMLAGEELRGTGTADSVLLDGLRGI